MGTELVSIIMPSYNSAAFIAYSIDSIIKQTYKNWELLISDDGSKDDTVCIVKSYIEKDKRIKLFELNENKGAGFARNNSIKEAKGRYIAFCDSDDMWLPEKLERQISFMENNNYTFTFGSYNVCNKNGDITGRVIAPSKVSLTSTKRDDKIGFLTAVYDSNAIDKLYMPILRKRQDWAYVLEILKKSHYAYAIKEPMAIYRKCRGSISHNKFSLIKYNAKVYEIVFNYSPFKSYCYLFFLFLPTYGFKIAKNKYFNFRNRHGY